MEDLEEGSKISFAESAIASLAGSWRSCQPLLELVASKQRHNAGMYIQVGSCLPKSSSCRCPRCRSGKSSRPSPWELPEVESEEGASLLVKDDVLEDTKCQGERWRPDP